MAGGHSHTHSQTHLRLSRAAGRVLAVVIAVTLLATVVAIIALWPRSVPATAQVESVQGMTGEISGGRVTAIRSEPCAGTSEDRLPDGSIPATVDCPVASVTLTSGQQVDVRIPGPAATSAIIGQQVRVSDFGDGSTEQIWTWVDYDRSRPLIVLAVLLTAAIIGVGRLRGLAAIAGLAISFAAIFLYIIPGLQAGRDPLAISITGSIAIMTVILYLAHGFTAKTTAALVGTVAGLLLAAALGSWATRSAHLDGMVSEDRYLLTQLTGMPNLSGLVLAGVILAGLGVLNDVTITQSSAVWELRATSPDLGFRQLFTAGMRIGRDHLASTVYTVVFAYAGAALPVLMLLTLYNQPLSVVLNGAELGEELVRTMVGSLGLIAAIPLTTAVAALLVLSATPVGSAQIGAAQPSHDGARDAPQSATEAPAGVANSAESATERSPSDAEFWERKA